MAKLVWIIVIIIAIFGIYYFSQDNLSSDNLQLSTVNNLSVAQQNNPATITSTPEDSFPNTSNLHWTHMPITYSFTNLTACGNLEPNFVIKAFKEIQTETNNTVSFKQVEGNGDIAVNCKTDFNLNKTAGTYQVGDATITKLEENKIFNAAMNFYIVPGTVNAGSCPYADVEVHEVLHTLGFGHTSEKYNIMNPVSLYCPTHLNADIFDKLMSTYEK